MELSSFYEKPCSIHFNGYCKEFDDFILQAYNKASSCGCIIQDKLQNPTAGNVEYFQDKLGVDFECSLSFFKTKLSSWLPQLNLHQQEVLSTSVFEVFNQLKTSGKNDSALRNFYTKLMCWLYYKFAGVLTKIGTSVVPVIIYVAPYGTYELRTMQILNLCGCSVAYVSINETENDYKKYDIEYKCSSLYEFQQVKAFPPSWSLSEIRKSILQQQQIEKTLGDRSNLIKVEVNDSADLFSIEGCKCSRLHVLGTSEEWSNTLYEMRGSLKDAEFIEGNIPPVRPDEILNNNTSYPNVEACLESLLGTVVLSDMHLTTTFKYAFYESINKLGITNISKCIAYFYICLRYKNILNNGYLFVLTDNISDTTKFVLTVLTYFNMNIVVLNPSKADLPLNVLRKQELPDTESIAKFPTSKQIIGTTTVASKAESEIQDVLYNGELGIFKENQYSQANVSYLNCTYDEIKLLWHEELRMRQGFETKDDIVTLPTIYARLGGIPDGDYSRFTQTLNDLKSDAILIENDIYKEQAVNLFAAECMENSKVSIQKIKQHRAYKYAYLRDDIQSYMLSKIQELLDIGIIQGVGKNGVENTLFQVALNLPQQFLQAIQNFDFTKKNPKLINVRTSTEQMSLQDSILVTYLSLLGFDILLVVPTGYNVLNAHTTRELFKNHEFGNYEYNFKLSDINQKSFFGKLFGRR